MKIFKRDEKPHNREPAFFVAAHWLVDTTWSTIWSGLKAVGKGFDALLMGLSWLPVSSLRKVGLDTAVRRGWVTSVKRLATPELFRSMTHNFNRRLVQLAMKDAINQKAKHSTDIVTTLLSHGGVLSKGSLYSNSLFSGLLLDLNPLTNHPQLVRTAIEHNAVHDDLKYDIFLKAISSPTFQKHNFAEQMLDAWKDFFKNAQQDAFLHDHLWKKVIQEGSDAVVRKLIECTPQHLLTPFRLSPVFAQRTDISVSTFNMLEQRGLDIEDIINSILKTYSQWPSHQSYLNVNKNAMSSHVWLENNFALKEVVEHARNIKQNNRLLQCMTEDNEEPKTSLVSVQRKRKM